MDAAVHPHANRVLGAPPDWDPKINGTCGYLAIADVRRAGDLPFMESAWRPSADELQALNAGGWVLIGIQGTIHPPVYMGVIVPPQEPGARPKPDPETPNSRAPAREAGAGETAGSKSDPGTTALAPEKTNDRIHPAQQAAPVGSQRPQDQSL